MGEVTTILREEVVDDPHHRRRPSPPPGRSTPSRPTARARRRSTRSPASRSTSRPRVHRDHGSVRFGQEHADAVRRRARPAHVRARPSSATPTSPKLNKTQLTLLRRDRLGFIFQQYNLIPTLTSHENILLPLTLAGERARRRVVRRRSSRPSASATGSTTCRASCRAASSSASRSPARWCRGPTSSSPTSRPARSTPRRASRSSRSCARGRRHGPDDRDGHPRPARGVVREQGAVPRRRPDHRRDGRPDDRPGARPDEAVRGLSAVFKLAWRGVRHNAGRYVATLVAIITGVAFFSATGFLSDRVIDALEGDVDRQYGNVDVAVVVGRRRGCRPTSPTSCGSPAQVADEIAARRGVEAAAAILTAPVAFLARTASRSPTGATGRLWIADDELNPLDVDDGKAPRGRARSRSTGAPPTDARPRHRRQGRRAHPGREASRPRSSASRSSATPTPSTTAARCRFSRRRLRLAQLRARSSTRTLPAWQRRPAGSRPRSSRVVPGGFEVQTGEELPRGPAQRGRALGQFLKNALQGFALLALFVGGVRDLQHLQRDRRPASARARGARGDRRDAEADQARRCGTRAS